LFHAFFLAVNFFGFFEDWALRTSADRPLALSFGPHFADLTARSAHRTFGHGVAQLNPFGGHFAMSDPILPVRQ
jgi:hypothetical protein